jgi:hypothetical protein
VLTLQYLIAYFDALAKDSLFDPVAVGKLFARKHSISGLFLLVVAQLGKR